ncbi:hypothetical protein JOL62DRAFT_600554 [Phyllosticta paracitricarpa]|uniref:Uncharacterized protein n=1 Tax=Phyllosticta paracitricarpa TaxID=2016321 RepID=A0ABR1NJE6_9PEZI
MYTPQAKYDQYQASKKSEEMLATAEELKLSEVVQTENAKLKSHVKQLAEAAGVQVDDEREDLEYFTELVEQADNKIERLWDLVEKICTITENFEVKIAATDEEVATVQKMHAAMEGNDIDFKEKFAAAYQEPSKKKLSPSMESDADLASQRANAVIATTIRKRLQLIGPRANNNLCDSNFHEARRNLPRAPTSSLIAAYGASGFARRTPRVSCSAVLDSQFSLCELTNAKMMQTQEGLRNESLREIETEAAQTWWRIYGSQVPKYHHSAHGRAKAAFAFAMAQQEHMRAALARMQSELHELVQRAIAAHESLPGSEFEGEIMRNVEERDGHLRALNTTMWLCFAFLMYLRRGGGVLADEEEVVGKDVDVWSDV